MRENELGISEMNDNQKNQLLDFFETLHPLTQPAKNLLTDTCFELELKKNGFLFKPGMDTHTIYYLISGVVRGYRKYRAQEITTWLNEEGEIITSISNIGLDAECEEYIQAITEAKLIGIPASTIQALFAECPEATVISRLLLEDNYRGAEERAFICRIPVAADRYNRFIKKHPGLVNRIPLKYTASYLGMRLETLCRLRSNKTTTSRSIPSI